jgi:hypothetical protein
MTGLKANSWQNAYYVMTTLLVVECGCSIQQRLMHPGCKLAQRSSGKARRSCIGHLITVGPLLIDEARKKTIEEQLKILEGLKKQSGPLTPGVLPPVVKPLLAP